MVRKGSVCDEVMMHQLQRYVIDATPEKMRMMLVTENGRPMFECFNPQNFILSKPKTLTNSSLMYFASYNTMDSRFEYMKPRCTMQTPVVYCPFGALFNEQYNKFHINMMLDGLNQATANFIHHLQFWRFVGDCLAQQLYQESAAVYSVRNILKDTDDGASSMTVKAAPETPVFNQNNTRIGALMDVKIPKGSRIRAVIHMVGFMVREMKIELIWKIAQINLVDKKLIENTQSMFVEEEVQPDTKEEVEVQVKQEKQERRYIGDWKSPSHNNDMLWVDRT